MKKIYSFLIAINLLIFAGNVQAQVPSCTTNLSPANFSTNLNPQPYITLKWTAAAGATSYDIYLSSKIPPTQLIANVSSDTFNLTTAAYNTTYYWYVVPRNASGPATGCGASPWVFVTGAPPPPPSNDDCSGATTISTTPISGTTLEATQSQPATPGCTAFIGTADDDVWYQFTALSTGPLVISMTGSSSFDGVVEAFAGSCGSLTSLTCSDSSGQGGTENLTINAVSGTNYKFRVYSYGGTTSDRGTFTISVAGPLPVTLLSFKGNHDVNKNIISWTTATEQNNTGFELQYSSNGTSFDPLSFVNSKAVNGNSSSELSYVFTDTRLLSGTAYYRLQQIDKDGRSSYSNIISLKGEKVNALTLSNLYPNPTRNKLNLMIAAPVNDMVKIEILDITGKIVKQQINTIIIGDNKVPIDVAALPAGSYFIKAVGNNGYQTAVSKFVKE